MRAFSSIITLVAVVVTISGCGNDKKKASEKDLKAALSYVGGKKTDKNKESLEKVKGLSEKELRKLTHSMLTSTEESYKKHVTDSKAPTYEEFKKLKKDDKKREAIVNAAAASIKKDIDNDEESADDANAADADANDNNTDEDDQENMEKKT